MDPELLLVAYSGAKDAKQVLGRAKAKEQRQAAQRERER